MIPALLSSSFIVSFSVLPLLFLILPIRDTSFPSLQFNGRVPLFISSHMNTGEPSECYFIDLSQVTSYIL